MDRMVFRAFLLSCYLASSFSLKIRTFYVPGKASNEAPLLCTYDLENDTLYDVKWYKDNEQFFRCEPNGVQTAYEVDGVKVQQVKYAPLGTCSLTLFMLTQKTAGEYRCEVNTEGPKFLTISQTKKMLIFESPKKRLQHSDITLSNNSVVQYQQTPQENEVIINYTTHIQINFVLLLVCSAIITQTL